MRTFCGLVTGSCPLAAARLAGSSSCSCSCQTAAPVHGSTQRPFCTRTKHTYTPQSTANVATGLTSRSSSHIGRVQASARPGLVASSSSAESIALDSSNKSHAQQSQHDSSADASRGSDSSGTSLDNGHKLAKSTSSNKISAKALLQSVTYFNALVLPPESNWQSAVAALQRAVAAAAQHLESSLPSTTSSGVVRFEVPLPRGGPGDQGLAGFTALQWLQGQDVLRKTLHQVYFSGRHSTAPDTPGTAAAEAAAGGWGSVAGLGAAWLWQGLACQGFDSGVMSGLQRFLSESQPRLRVLGGSRFNPAQAPAPEWAAFGSYLFMLPQVELMEVDGSLLLAVNVAWDTRLPHQQQVNAAAAGQGPSSLAAAVQQAQAVLAAVQPPARACAAALAPTTGPAAHTPDEQGWQQLMDDAIRVLRGGTARTPGGVGVDTDLARQEFISGGQQSLDELLSALRAGDPDPTPMATVEETLDEESGSSSSSGGGSKPQLDASDRLHATALKVATAAAAVSGSKQQHDHIQQQQFQQQKLVKLVLARRTALPWQYGHQQDDISSSEQQQQQLPPLAQQPAGWQRTSGAVLLQALQERDPRAYQLYVSTPPGAAFLACTPERLYVRSGRHVASEAVAGTRPRGPPGDLEADFYQGLDLLQSPKDHAEFTVVREWIKQQLSPLCVGLKVEVQKSVLKQASVQHLYGRLAGVLKRGVGDAAVLEALHPTPAVCGRPREAALEYLAEHEPFDRGFYAGPFGWVSGHGAEFAVAIRSAMLPTTPAAGDVVDQPAAAPEQQGQLLAYAGVGVVQGSEAASEWQELCLKVRQFEGLLSPLLAPPLASLPNCVMAWAALVVEELTRLGVNAFAVAPGSRSSPLALAAASHPRSQLTVAIDERSLGFWALGFSRANPNGLPAAVICSSGTAVANLLPAVVEASQSNIPLLLLTADRPYELRDTGANQTIDQVKIFGGYTRWTSDVCPPSEQLPGRVIVSTIDTAVRHSVAAPQPGPVHLNFQFREPLAPSAAPWNSDSFLRGLEAWQLSAEPYSTAVRPAGSNALQLPGNLAAQQQWQLNGHSSSTAGLAAGSPELNRVLQLLLTAQRGLIVVGEQSNPSGAAAAMQLAAALGWPVAADVLSGLRVGSQQQHSNSSSDRLPVLLHHFDHVLLGAGGAAADGSWWSNLQPDVVLQLGPRVTSKRINQFMEWSAQGANGSQAPTPWLMVHPGPERHDAAHLINCHLTMQPQQLLQLVSNHLQQHRSVAGSSSTNGRSSSDVVRQQWQRPASPYAQLLQQLNAVAAMQIDASLAEMTQLSEMAVARVLAAQLPAGSGLFLGNSMPIRDMDMYAGSRAAVQPLAPAEVAVATHSSAASASSTDGEFHGGSSTAAASSTPISGTLESLAEFEEDDVVDIGSMPLGGLVTGSAGFSSTVGSSSGLGRSVGSGFGQTQRQQGSGVWDGSMPETLVGVPVAANRGASGIDGVLSTAAGFAAGLKRPVTLVVGDLSFLHDVNGLSLLRGGEMAPPLTVVLVNNKGGGIFSFLPVAGAVGQEAFERLWGTPQNVDLEGMCRAHGIPHQRVTSPGDLSAALATAWGINRHSVVEVNTNRHTNLALHKRLQSAVAAAVHKAYDLLMQSTAAAAVTQQHQQNRLLLLPPVQLQPQLSIAAARVSSYSLRLAKPLTSTDSQGSAAPQYRQGLLLHLTLSSESQSCYNSHNSAESNTSGFSGVGEAAPLPGLHAETYDQASEQLQMLAQLLQGIPAPRTLALLSSGALTQWFTGVLGINPSVLYPSVRLAVESALLQALAAAQGCSLYELLQQQQQRQQDASSGSGGSSNSGVVAVNGLLPGTGSVDELVAAAHELIEQGYKAIKVKVGRRSSPAEDAAVIAALHKALSPKRIALTADANRAWSLDQALEFGSALAAACDATSSSGSVSIGSVLAYIEEPTQDPADMVTFYAETGIPVAVDESLDEGHIGPRSVTAARTAQEHLHVEPLELSSASGLAAVVIKPSVVSGFESAWAIAEWAKQQGVRAVISSSFESSIGLAALAQLAAAVDGNLVNGSTQQQAGSSSKSSAGTRTLPNGLWSGLGGAVLPSSNRMWPSTDTTAATDSVQQPPQQQWHGLGTLSWFAEDVAIHSQQQPQRSSNSMASAMVPADLAWQLLQDAAAVTHRSTHGSSNGSTSNQARLLHTVHQAVRFEQVQYSVPSPVPGVQMHVTGLYVHPSHKHNTSSCMGDNGSKATDTYLPVVLLHGFMGSAADWQPLMAALAAAGHPCLALKLPGHSGTAPVIQSTSSTIGEDMESRCYSILAAADAVEAAAAAAFAPEQPCLLVAYSMGARVALQITLKSAQQQQQQQQTEPAGGVVQWAGAVIVSGTPGIPDSDLRAARVERDAELADMLTQLGSAAFLTWWYNQPLWGSLRRHPGFSRLLAKRAKEQQGQELPLAAALKHGSTGKMEPMWGELKGCQVPMLLVAGQLDTKFAGIKRRMFSKLRQRQSPAGQAASVPASNSSSDSNIVAAFTRDAVEQGGVGMTDVNVQVDTAESCGQLSAAELGAELQQLQQQRQRQHVISHQWAEVPGVGHAVHVEAPLQLLQLIKGFISQLQ